MNDQLDNIIKYLDNEMSETERFAFEKQIRNDEMLAKEVVFQRGLHGFLNRKKPALEQKLSNLGDEFILNPTEKKTRFSVWKVIVILLSMALIAYFSLLYKNNDTIEKALPQPETEEQSPIKIEEINKTETIEQEKNTETPQEENKPKTPTIRIDQPIASLDKANYDQNPILESVMKENYRSDASENTMFITKPKADVTFKSDEKIPLIVTGYTDIEPNYRLIIYSNRSFDIENDYRVLDTSLSGKSIDGTNHFRFNGEIPLEKGLYYLVMKKDGSRDVLYISRFTVK